MTTTDSKPNVGKAGRATGKNDLQVRVHVLPKVKPGATLAVTNAACARCRHSWRDVGGRGRIYACSTVCSEHREERRGHSLSNQGNLEDIWKIDLDAKMQCGHVEKFNFLKHAL